MSSSADPITRPQRRGLLSLWPYAVLLAVGIFVLVPRLGDFGFWDPWEPKYAESAREMIERDELVVEDYWIVLPLQMEMGSQPLTLSLQDPLRWGEPIAEARITLQEVILEG